MYGKSINKAPFLDDLYSTNTFYVSNLHDLLTYIQNLQSKEVNLKYISQ